MDSSSPFARLQPPLNKGKSSTACSSSQHSHSLNHPQQDESGQASLWLCLPLATNSQATSTHINIPIPPTLRTTTGQVKVTRVVRQPSLKMGRLPWKLSGKQVEVGRGTSGASAEDHGQGAFKVIHVAKMGTRFILAVFMPPPQRQSLRDSDFCQTQYHLRLLFKSLNYFKHALKVKTSTLVSPYIIVAVKLWVCVLLSFYFSQILTKEKT